MMQAQLSFSSRNPDVLSCIANLSNDAVFTPPELANEMLDMLEKAWSESNNGESIWENPNVTFLDPCTKTGIFLREIVKRLVDGLENEIPDLQKRVDHILTKQVFGIATETLTGLLARRSVYCSKYANGKHSIANSFDEENGNIWFARTEHSWVGGNEVVLTADEKGNPIEKKKNGKCEFCGASQREYERDETLESHAYAFIHTENIKERMREIFGGEMKFDVIIGNPPYQLSDGGNQASAKPIYNQFVVQAKKLEPRFLTMVIPARWYAGGKGLEEFRTSMLKDGRISVLHDFPDTQEVFPGVNNRGGICYFLWDSSHTADTKVFTHDAGTVTSVAMRPLLEQGLETFVRFNEGIEILKKVVAVESKNKNTGLLLPVDKQFKNLVSSRKPFGLDTSFIGHEKPGKNDLKVYRNKGVCFVNRSKVVAGFDLVDTIKLLVPYASPGSDDYPHLVLSKPILAGPAEIATETYLVIGPFVTMAEAKNVASYMGTYFFRFMVNLLRVSHHVTRNVYNFVPLQDFSQQWSDEDLFRRYSFTDEEIQFIQRYIKPVSWAGDFND